MRIERKGPVARITSRLERFFQEALGGVPLDDVQHAEVRKADFKCLNGLLAIELKSLEEDASHRMNNLTDELRQRPDWPIFLGSAPMQSVLERMREPDEIKRSLIDRLGRAIKNHMRKANKQLGAHEAAFPRKNMVKLMVLANEDHEIYDPEMVAYIVQHLLLRRENNVPFYPNIDAVIYVTERHAGVVDHQVAFPILCIEGASIETAPWKYNVIDLFVRCWATWNGVSLYDSAWINQKFTTVDHIPDQMRRHEMWELAYRRNPYMRKLTTEQLRARFDELICVSSLAFMKHSPLKPDRAAIMRSMQSMSHIMLEMGWRAIPVTEFQYGPERLAAAARRMQLPQEVIAWFESNLGRTR
jgi:hypothetical protein